MRANETRGFERKVSIRAFFKMQRVAEGGDLLQCLPRKDLEGLLCV